MSDGVSITLGEHVLAALAGRIVEMLPRHEPATSPWLDVDGAAKHLATTVDSIRGMVKREQIPVHKPNGRLLFDRRELDAWVQGA